MSQRAFTNPWNNYTFVKNAVFDYIMPTLSGNAWKAMCVAIRQTCSIGAVTDDVVWVTLPGFMQNAGIPDKTKIELALQECIYAGYMVAAPDNKTATQPRYALNVQYELPTTERPPRISRAALQPTPAESKSASQAEAKPAALNVPAGKKAVYAALCRFGKAMGAAFDPQLVLRAVTDNSDDNIAAWINLGQGMTHLGNTARFQMALERLLAGVPPMPLSMLAPDDSAATPSAPVSAPPSAPSAQADELWAATLKALRTQLRSSLFKWFKPTKAVDLRDNVLRVSVPNSRTKTWLETGQVADKITRTFHEVSRGKTLEFIVK